MQYALLIYETSADFARREQAGDTHPVDEVVTVISGTFYKGMGETADPR
jgi:hypothetical protein